MIDLNNLKFVQENREKEHFYSSDFGKSLIDLYFAFTKEPVTNPPKWSDTLKWEAGKGVESGMLIILKMNGVVPQDYDQKEHGRIELKYKTIQINGYIDALTVTGLPIEIKSINNKNAFDISKYENGYPRENYVGQLATYMESKGVDRGFLFVASVDGLSYFWFECQALGNGKYKCGNVTVDLYKEWDKWVELKDIVDSGSPAPFNYIFEYVYKFPIENIDWNDISKTDIGKARNGHKVIGDWQVLWSNWKNRLIELQNTTLGYTEEELSRIKQLTEGYSVRGWVFDKDKKPLPRVEIPAENYFDTLN
ncbi:MAG TPA: hypothetical protein PKV66_02545 [Candidatus Pelethenecus sp.]|nr:hypothetical protein [Candidatus Pelethenecus sp.]